MRGSRRLCALTSAVILGSVWIGPSAAAGGGGCYPDPTAPTRVARLSGSEGRAGVELCAFQPTVLYVDEGAEVTWVNKDPFQHTVTGANVGWGSERYLSQGDTLTQRFDDAGVFPFYCMLHPGMVGTVVVGDPDPADVTTELTAVDTSGIASGDQAAAPPDAAPAADAQPSSDVLPGSLTLTLVLALVAGAGGGVLLLRRRSRAGQRAQPG